MKRLFYVLALVAVLALAGTAAAGPAVTINGSSSITVSGSTDDLTPSVGGLSFGMNQNISISGDKWSLSGNLYLPHSASLGISAPKDSQEVIARFGVTEVNEGTTETPDYHYYVNRLGWELIDEDGSWVAIAGYDENEYPEYIEDLYEVYVDDQGKPVFVLALVDISYVTDVSGSLTHGTNPWFSLYNWKLTMDVGMFKFAFGNNVDLTGYGDYNGYLSLASKPSGNHMQVVAPLPGLTLVYDKADSQEGLYIEVPKGAIPFSFKGIYDATGRRVSGTVHYDFANNFWTEFGGVVAQNNNAVGYGAEINIPVTGSLNAYLVAKQFQVGYPGIGGNTYTLGDLTYTQPQYKVRAYIWSRLNGGAVVERNQWLEASFVQKAGNSLSWWSDSYGAGYRSLKGLGVYAKYDIDSPSLLLGVGAPVVADKASLKLWTNDALASSLGLNGQLYVKVSPKLASTTDFSYAQGSGIGKITEGLSYTVSSSASVGVTLTKPAGVNSVDYTAKFTVSY